MSVVKAEIRRIVAAMCWTAAGASAGIFFACLIVGSHLREHWPWSVVA